MHRVVLMVIAALMAGHSAASPAPFAIDDPFLDHTACAPEVIAIPATTFTMGSQPRDPGYTFAQLPHRVTLTPFAIGQHEVTNEEFCAFLNDREFQTDVDPRWLLMVEMTDLCPIVKQHDAWMPRRGWARRPVVTVTWFGARAYCRWLSDKTGKSYDLPSAAQWEAAARAGSTTMLPWGSAADPRMARTRGPHVDGPADVASYPPNAWGLYDMIGNVWEWVLDCFDVEFYAASPAVDPLMLDETCPTPEVRGGSWAEDVAEARPGFRTNYPWNGVTDRIGFRVMRVLDDDERRRLQ